MKGTFDECSKVSWIISGALISVVIVSSSNDSSFFTNDGCAVKGVRSILYLVGALMYTFCEGILDSHCVDIIWEVCNNGSDDTLKVNSRG